jgi:hypothetical protein
MTKRFFNQLIVILFFTNSLFSASITWTGLGTSGVWEDPDNWDLERVPEFDDRVFIDGPFTVTYASNITLKYLELDHDAYLTIAAGYTLTVIGSGNDGVSLEDNGSNTTLIVKGTLIVSDHGQDGIDVNDNAYMQVDATGSVYISNSVSDGMELNGDVTNFGYISITNSTSVGLNAKGTIDRFLMNHGTIEISGAPVCFDGSNWWHIFNYGTIKLYDATSWILDEGTNLKNYGIFEGEGYTQNGNFNDLIFFPGSFLKPGIDGVGKITMEESLELINANLEIEINGANDYDQIEIDTGVITDGELEITGTNLILIGDYIPQPGDEFMIFELTNPFPIIGHFAGLPEGSTLVFNGVSMTISYTGGASGNALTLEFQAPLPVELIEFNARPLDSKVQLNWTTASELNNDYFTIERSADGRNFIAIANIDGKGTTSEFSKYYHTDTEPLSGLSYYRLKQTDFDGGFSYSDIKTVEILKGESVKIYPTIVNNAVYIETDDAPDSDTTIIVSDMSGKVHKSFQNDAKASRMEFSLSDLTPGSYFIIVQGYSSIHTQKIIKQ